VSDKTCTGGVDPEDKKKFFFSFWKSPNLIFHSLFKLLLRGWAFADPSSTTLRTQELVFLATIYIAPVMFILFLALWRLRNKTLFFLRNYGTP